MNNTPSVNPDPSVLIVSGKMDSRLPIERCTELMKQIVANNTLLIELAMKIKDPKERAYYLNKIKQLC